MTTSVKKKTINRKEQEKSEANDVAACCLSSCSHSCYLERPGRPQVVRRSCCRWTPGKISSDLSPYYVLYFSRLILHLIRLKSFHQFSLMFARPLYFQLYRAFKLFTVLFVGPYFCSATRRDLLNVFLNCFKQSLD